MHAEIIHCMCQDLSDAYAQFLATNHLRMERAPRRAMKLRGRLLLSRTLPQTALRKRLRLATQHVQSALCEPLRRGLSSRSPRRCMLNFCLQATAMLSLFVTICKVMRRCCELRPCRSSLNTAFQEYTCSLQAQDTLVTGHN